jgi:hypothetical protein
MTDSREKADLRYFLIRARDALLWKLDGLSEYDVRRPLVPTGTNLLGLVKHVAGVSSEYFGACYGRPFGESLPGWAADAETNADHWATADESREQIIGLYRRVWAHADATIDALDLDATGYVSWWPPERREPPLRLMLVYVVAEIERHAGQADIVRELIDGTIGLRASASNLPQEDQAWWEAYRTKVEQAAKDASA